MTVECGECHRVLEESPSAKTDERRPCPGCGSLARHIQVNIESTVVVRDDLAVKAKRGPGKPFLEQKIGSDFHRATGTWRHRVMVVDRDRDHYKKVVTDPVTGEELYRKEEPLSEHTDRGSAKKKKRNRR